MIWLTTILDIIFPVNCISCQKTGVDLCTECLQASPEAERESANWIFPMFDYRHPAIKNSIWLLKYKNKKGLARVFAEVLYGRIIEEISDLQMMDNFCDPVIMSIPLAKNRLRERGFNQTELICEELVKLDTGKNFFFFKDILVKPKDTIHQARIENRGERLKNIVGSFSVLSPEKIKSRNIILIDDVTTTGATFSEARKVLKNCGARKIVAFAIGH